MQDIIGKVLHRLIDLDPAVLKRIELTMEPVLSDYDIQKKGTEMMPINASWQTELQICEVGTPSENAYHYFVTKNEFFGGYCLGCSNVERANRNNARETATMYVKQMYGGTWGNWIALAV